MAMADTATALRQGAAARPQLTASMRSSSYLSDHQQYRPPRQPEPHHHACIDAVVEVPRASASAAAAADAAAAAAATASASASGPIPRPVLLPFRGIPSEENPPTIVDSGVNHRFSHPNCAPVSGHPTDRIVATLFYKAAGKRAAAHASSPSSSSSSLSSSMSSSVPPAKAAVAGGSEPLPANMAPTTALDAFPLEPPTQEPEQLDRLYGSYISPLCITSFLHLMSTFPQPRDADPPHSSHRCLDNQELPRVVELTLAPAPSPKYLALADLRKHEMIYRFEREWNVDVALQRDVVWRRHPRLVVFDMDSTLITQEVIELMAHTVKDPPDLAARIADITNRAMLGELEFEASFRERLALLKGTSASLFEELRPVLNVTRGAAGLVKALKRLGVKTAVVSGGFQPLTDWLARDLGIDYAYANEVVVADGKLTGEAKGIIVGKERKRDLLVEIAAGEGIDLAQVVAVGDGANDLLMMHEAGLGVAWNAKPRVQMEADARLNGDSLLDLLFLFGFTSEEIGMLVG